MCDHHAAACCCCCCVKEKTVCHQSSGKCGQRTSTTMLASATEVEVELHVPDEISTFFGVTWAQDPRKDKVWTPVRLGLLVCLEYCLPLGRARISAIYDHDALFYFCVTIRTYPTYTAVYSCDSRAPLSLPRPRGGSTPFPHNSPSLIHTR